VSLKDRVGNKIAYLEGSIEMAEQLHVGGVIDFATLDKLKYAHEVLKSIESGPTIAGGK
jgi:hypothetical protein